MESPKSSDEFETNKYQSLEALIIFTDLSVNMW